MARRILERADRSKVLDLQDRSGETPLHLAFHKMNLPIVLLLLSYNADLSKKNKKGQRPVDIMNTIDRNKQIVFLEQVVKETHNRSCVAKLEAKKVELTHELEKERLRRKAKENQLIKREEEPRVVKAKSKLQKAKKELSIPEMLDLSLEKKQDFAEEDLDFNNPDEEPDRLLNIEELKEFMPGIMSQADALFDQTLAERNFFFDNFDIKFE